MCKKLSSSCKVFILTLFTCQQLVHKVYGFPGGGPYKSCANLYPKHHTNAQLTPPPYEVIVSKETYEPNDVITVTLKSKDASEAFKGFMLRANRLKGDTEEIVGNFIDIPATGNPRFWYPAEENITNCVTHKNNDEKIEVIVKWQAPASTLGDIQFYATFVKNYDIFWVFVPSAVISAVIPLNDTHNNASISTDFQPLDLNECGKTKGCMLYPAFCSDANCEVAVTYKAHDNGVDFEAMAPEKGYLTFAISEDGEMGNDETITCMVTNDFVSVQHGFNPAYYNDRHRITGITNIETQREDGKLHCRWTMPYINSITHLKESAGAPPVAQTHVFDLKQEWKIFLAWGKLYAGADVLAKHEELPLVSKQKVKFTDNSVIRANGLYLAVKAHGCLMMLGYILLFGIAVITSRHYRQAWNFKIKGADAWFQVHRALMITGAILIAISFIIIFVKVKGWSTANNTHAVLGTITTALVAMQILAGFLRPKHTSTKRPIFNWLHRIGGKTTQIFSAVTIILSVFATYMNHQLQQWMIVVFVLWILVQFFWEVFVYEIYRCTRNSSDDNTNMKELENLHRDGTSSANPLKQNNKFLFAHFIVYSLIIFAITVAAIVILSMF